MIISELIEKLQALPDQDVEIFVAHDDEEDGEDILEIEIGVCACFIIYKKKSF